MRRYKCFYCGAIIDHFLYRYDSAPNGDDEAVCPKCRRDEGVCEWKEEEEDGGD